MSDFLRDLAGGLVACDTVSSGSNVAAVELLADRLDALGARVALQRYESAGVAKANLAASLGPAVEGGLIVSGHVDTVPFADQPGWTREPLRLEIDEERVYGRGTTDMKVFLAQCVEAARTLDRDRLKCPLVFLFTADEEIGCLGAGRLTGELERLLEVPVPRLCWIGEPTSFGICHAHKSIGTCEIRVAGRGGHSALPGLGVNAIAVMGKVIEALGAYGEELRTRPAGDLASVFPDAPWATLNLGTIRGGSATNMIAEECRMRVSFRSLPGQKPEDLYREIGKRLASLDTRDAAGGEHRATIEIGDAVLVPPLLSPRDTALERALLETLGARPVRGALFATDGCRFAAGGIDSIICGPGDFEQAHQPNESVSREAFERGPGIVRAVVERLCASDPLSPLGNL